MSGSDSSIALQKAIIDVLRADEAVKAIVVDRVWDAPPEKPKKPYISLGPMQVLADVADGYEGSDVALQVDGWAEGPAQKAIHQLGAAIRAALSGADLALGDDQRLVNIEPEQTNYLVEPDGITQHAAVTFTARTEPTA